MSHLYSTIYPTFDFELKFLFGISFLSIYLLALSYQLLPYVDYAINKEYIAEVLCENQDEPELHCNGICHLKKQLKKAEEKEKEAPVSIRLEMQYTMGESLLLSHRHLSEVERKIDFRYQFNIKTGDVIGIFHPPRLMV